MALLVMNKYLLGKIIKFETTQSGFFYFIWEFTALSKDFLKHQCDVLYVDYLNIILFVILFCKI